MKEIPVKHELEFHADALPGHVNPDDEAERLPINYLQLAIRHKWWLLSGLMVGAVAGHLAYMRAGPEYEAVAQILVSRKYMPPVRESERMLPETGQPSERIPLIISPMIAEKALELGHLKELPTLRGEPDLVELVLDGLKVKRIAGQDRSHSNVLEIRYPSRVADDARQVVKALIATYDEYLVQQSREHSTEHRPPAHTHTTNGNSWAREITDASQDQPDNRPRSLCGAQSSSKPLCLATTSTVVPSLRRRDRRGNGEQNMRMIHARNHADDSWPKD